jgi:hypothetical protein
MLAGFDFLGRFCVILEEARIRALPNELNQRVEPVSQRLQRGAVERTYPEWMRVLAVLCLLLVSGASTAQAAHIHGQWLPHHAAQAGEPMQAAQSPGGEERCVLCMAMHAALPVSMRVEPVRVALVAVRVFESADRVVDSHWHFAMFSRPPPAADVLARA